MDAKRGIMLWEGISSLGAWHKQPAAFIMPCRQRATKEITSKRWREVLRTFELLDPAGSEGSPTAGFSVCQQINFLQLAWVASDLVAETILTILKREHGEIKRDPTGRTTGQKVS